MKRKLDKISWKYRRQLVFVCVCVWLPLLFSIHTYVERVSDSRGAISSQYMELLYALHTYLSFLFFFFPLVYYSTITEVFLYIFHDFFSSFSFL